MVLNNPPTMRFFREIRRYRPPRLPFIYAFINICFVITIFMIIENSVYGIRIKIIGFKIIYICHLRCTRQSLHIKFFPIFPVIFSYIYKTIIGSCINQSLLYRRFRYSRYCVVIGHCINIPRIVPALLRAHYG